MTETWAKAIDGGYVPDFGPARFPDGAFDLDLKEEAQ